MTLEEELLKKMNSPSLEEELLSKINEGSAETIQPISSISEDAKLASDKAMQYPRVQRELGVVPITRTIRGQVVPGEVADKYREIERYSKKREVKDYSKTEDWIADPMRAGTIDSILGKTADVADDIKGGSGYRTDSSAWADAVSHPIDTFTSKEKTKKIVQDLAYLTGQQLADLPVILGIGAVTGGSLGMAMGGASVLHGGLERKRDGILRATIKIDSAILGTDDPELLEAWEVIKTSLISYTEAIARTEKILLDFKTKEQQ